MTLGKARARQPEIIRSVQKDEIFTNQISDRVLEILRLVFTNNQLLRIQQHRLSNFLGPLLYYGFAATNNLQTLGEEYTGIVQVDHSFNNLPRKGIQLISYILEFGGDVIVEKLLHKLETQINQNESIIPDAKKSLLEWIIHCRNIIPYIKVFHRGLFYLQGSKYQISKRLSGINYILVRYWLNSNISLQGYRILGTTTLVQLGILLFNYVKRAKVEKVIAKSPQIHRAESLKSTENCILCLENRRNTTLTQCGHLFCWNCISDSLRQKGECPICRESITRQGIVCLRNYI